MRVDAGSNAKATNRTTNRRGLALLLAGAAGLVLSQVVLPKAHAQQTGGVQAWEASANSAVVGISPSSSGVYLTSTIGQAYAAYDQTETQATSALLNLGGLGYAVASSPVCGQSYSLSQQPQALTADSSNGPSSATTQAQLFPGVTTPQGSGTEHVSVSVKPEAAEARTYPVTQTVPGVLDVEGVAQSEVHYVDGTAQEASSSVTENLSLLGGKVSIDGLSWSASQQRGGADPTSRASFSYSTIAVQSVAGIPITIPGSVPISAALAHVNSAIGVVGLSISAPVEAVDPGTGGISMSPLQVHFSGSALENQLASPTVGPLTQIVNQINGQVTHGADCSDIKNLLGELSTIPETGLNLLISGFSGSGAVDLFFGGASADTLAAPSFSDPFDFGGAAGSTPLPTSGALVPPAIASDSGFANIGAPAASAAAASPAAAPSAATPSSNDQRPMAIGAVRCTTTSPNARAGCWRGLATWAAAAVVVLGGGLLAADAVYSRRQPAPRRRRRRFLV